MKLPEFEVFTRPIRLSAIALEENKLCSLQAILTTGVRIHGNSFSEKRMYFMALSRQTQGDRRSTPKGFPRVYIFFFRKVFLGKKKERVSDDTRRPCNGGRH